jgi:hypothetical protein
MEYTLTSLPAQPANLTYHPASEQSTLAIPADWQFKVKLTDIDLKFTTVLKLVLKWTGAVIVVWSPIWFLFFLIGLIGALAK